MGYIHILRDTASYRNAFFYPHGACFTLVYPESFSFCVLAVRRVLLYLAPYRFTFTCYVCGRVIVWSWSYGIV